MERKGCYVERSREEDKGITQCDCIVEKNRICETTKV